MWNDVIVTNINNLTAIEKEVAEVDDIEKKLNLAKKLLNLKIEVDIKQINQNLTHENIVNPHIFVLPYEFLCLELIFEDLSNGQEDTVYGNKTKTYKQKFEELFKQAVKIMQIDLNNDNKTDKKPINTGVIKR